MDVLELPFSTEYSGRWIIERVPRERGYGDARSRLYSTYIGTSAIDWPPSVQIQSLMFSPLGSTRPRARRARR